MNPDDQKQITDTWMERALDAEASLAGAREELDAAVYRGRREGFAKAISTLEEKYPSAARHLSLLVTMLLPPAGELGAPKR